MKHRPVSERCLVGFGSTSGPPMLPVLYNNNYQIVQTPDAVMILVEMVHDVRVVRMNGTRSLRLANGWAIRSATGMATRWWSTPPISPLNRFRGSSDNLQVIERFKRVDANTILYRERSTTTLRLIQALTIEYPFIATSGPVYDYACHEGNYAMQDILGGARKLESEVKK